MSYDSFILEWTLKMLARRISTKARRRSTAELCISSIWSQSGEFSVYREWEEQK